jgi:hypothetical protein
MSSGMSTRTHDAMMAEALEEARLAVEHDDVPVGAVVVDADGRIVGRGRNRREVDGDPTAHAEVVAIREAADARDVAARRMHALRHARAVHDVCRRDRAVAHRDARLRRGRREGRRGRVALRHGARPAAPAHGRRSCAGSSPRSRPRCCGTSSPSGADGAAAGARWAHPAPCCRPSPVARTLTPPPEGSHSPAECARLESG